MKKNASHFKGFAAALRSAALVFVLGFATGAAKAAPSGPASPVLTNAAWDCVLSGQAGEKGILFLDFTTNTSPYQFTVREITTRVAFNPQANPRGGAGAGSRGDAGATNSFTFTNVFGYYSTSGLWTYDVHGNTVGFFIEILESASSSATNYLTNTFNFTAKITPNKQLSGIYSSSLYGQGTLQGVPLKTLTNLSGSWVGKETINGVYNYEFFTLSNAGFPNTYYITGDGPGYSIGDDYSICMVSSQNKIALSVDKWYSMTNPPVTRATFGGFSRKPLGGNTYGIIGPSEASTNATYNAFWVSP